MSLHSGKVGAFLVFDDLDRSQHLDQALCVGYRFTDEPAERWTAFVNRVKANGETSVGRAAQVIRIAIEQIDFGSDPILVVPVLGSRDTAARSNSAVSRLAASIGEVDGYIYCSGLLRKAPHRSLHMLRGASSRDAEVEGKYKALRFHNAGVGKVGCVVLVDDLVTRGTTMNDAARAIREANGPIPVFGVALGKTERRSYWGGRINNDHLPNTILSVAGLV